MGCSTNILLRLTVIMQCGWHMHCTFVTTGGCISCKEMKYYNISGPYFSMRSCVVAVVGRIVFYYIRFTRMNNDVILKWVGGWVVHHFVFV